MMFHVLPGDPASLIVPPRADEETRANIRKEFGLDKPVHIQLLNYLNDLSPISVHEETPENLKKYNYTQISSLGESDVLVAKWPYMRRSFQTQRRVDEIMIERLEGTFWLTFSAIVFATIMGVLFGMIAALNQNTFWDHLMVGGSTLGVSTPSFVAALLMSVTFGFYLSEYTGLDMTGYMWKLVPYKGRQLELKHLILPALTLGVRPLAIITQLTRSSMLDVMSQDYIRTAKAKGVSNRTIVLKHALKNALNPVITAVSGWLASLMAGAFFVEDIFGWRGIGATTIKAVRFLDLPVIMGVTIVVASVFIIINILVDLLYAIIDPRVRLNDK